MNNAGQPVNLVLPDSMSQTLHNEINNLPCFHDKTNEIKPLTQGLNNAVFLVSNRRQQYAVKYQRELMLWQKEIAISHIAAEAQLAPKLIYQQPHWQVSDYISVPVLRDTALSDIDKISVCTILAAKFHQLNLPDVKLAELDCAKLLIELNNELSAELTSIAGNDSDFIGVQSIIKQAITAAQQSTCSHLMPVHGDLNFTNVLASKPHMMIDFETVSLASAEYEIAMMFAVNQLPISYLSQVLAVYQKHSAIAASLCEQEVTRNLLVAAAINGLWYLKQSFKQHCPKFKQLAIDQFQYAANVRF